jgi:hypothetical protein
VADRAALGDHVGKVFFHPRRLGEGLEVAVDLGAGFRGDGRLLCAMIGGQDGKMEGSGETEGEVVVGFKCQ